MRSAQISGNLRRATVTIAMLSILMSATLAGQTQTAAKAASQRSPVAPTREQVQAAINDARGSPKVLSVLTVSTQKKESYACCVKKLSFKTAGIVSI